MLCRACDRRGLGLKHARGRVQRQVNGSAGNRCRPGLYSASRYVLVRGNAIYLSSGRRKRATRRVQCQVGGCT